MEIEFEDEYLSDLYEGKKVKGKPKFQNSIIRAYIKTVNILYSANRIEDLIKFKSLNFEKLTNTELYSVRVNIQYRLEFRIIGNEITIISIVKLSKHYQ